MSYIEMYPNIPKQVHSLLVDRRIENLNQNECSEVVRFLRKNVYNTFTDFENGQFHDCFNLDEFLEAYVNRVVDSSWQNALELNQAILKVAETMTTMPLIPLLHLFLEDSQLDQVLKDLCNFLGVQTDREYAFILDYLTVSLQSLLTELHYTKKYLLDELLKRLFQRDKLYSFRNLSVLSYFNKATQDIIFELRLIHKLHVFLEDKKFDDINYLCNFLGVKSARDYEFVFDLLTENLQTLLIEFNDTKLNYTKEFLFNKLLDHLYTRNKLDSFHQVTVLGYFNQATQDIIFELRPFNDQAADIFAVTNQQQWDITFKLIQCLLTVLINKTQRDSYLLSQELQYEIKILDKHSMFSEEEVVADLRGIYRKIRKKYPYHPTTAPTEIPAWQPAVSEFEELNYGETDVETPAFVYDEIAILEERLIADKDSQNQETIQSILKELCDGHDDLIQKLLKSLEDYKDEMLAYPFYERVVREHFEDVKFRLLKYRLQVSRKFRSTKDITAYLKEVQTELINIKL